MLNNLSFKCQHADKHGCEAVVKYEFYKKHLAEDCVHKLVFPEEKKIELPIVNKKAINNGDDKVLPAGINLAQLFFEEGDDPIPWHMAVPVNNIVEEEEEDINMGNLFGDDDDDY